jgi:ABC-type glycerol-3-phosphate transport system substrate-binding protein
VSNLPFNQYVARGLLLDLYPLIDADPELDRSDLLESVIRATEINGGLYRIFPHFTIGTMVGNPAVVASEPGWNMDEFLTVLNANPDADLPLGQGLTRLNYLQVLFMITMSNYVDWDAGTTSFDSVDFMNLLMFANTLPENHDWDSDYIPESELITAGRQIMAPVGFYDFHDFQMYRALFGGELVFKGFPNESRNGNSLMANSGFAITTSCKDVDGAWEFVRTFISEDYQMDNFRRFGFSVLKALFEKDLQEAMAENEYGPGTMGWNGFTIELKPLTQADADQLMAFVDSVSISADQDEAIWNIVSEGATDFFNGRSSIQDTVRVIQNRASIYVSEQS